ncbi:hypothetical protein PFISCL1PPCAC_27186, partial [Pristionchus fissidentatus]
SRVAIMKSGLIAAQGSAQSLKGTYGNYFKLSLVVPNGNEDSVISKVKEHFNNAIRLNGNGSTHIFEIPRESGMKWSKLFSSAIKIAKILEAEDFFLSQASLEDAFIAIA